jgi:predicted O-methyltransferase YrrM
MSIEYEDYLKILHPEDVLEYMKDHFWFWVREKYQLSREFGTWQRMAEIGVRRGYSAWGFLKAKPNGVYLGVDDLSGSHQGKFSSNTRHVDTFPYVREMIMRELNREVSLLKADTRKLNFLPMAPFDLIHIDGNHNADGVLHDAILAWYSLEPGGRIIFDDYLAIPSVKQSIDIFVNAFENLILSHGLREKLMHGIYIVEKGLQK